ncbi:helix-turn-helix domain-containing protein [Microbacterium pumilum]|uniref:Helix-turn-helix domain-containing protein n=1 Tax=Microbacterium pumilum TaxID=344165 RepID=A0ABN2T2E4_9MICO
MTSPNRREPELWTIGGRAADEWLAEHRRDLVMASLRQLKPERDQAAELRWIVDYNIGLYIQMLGTPDLTLNEEAAGDLVASAARRASEGAPIEEVMRNYVDVAAVIWRTIVNRLAPDEATRSIEITAGVFRYLREVSTLVLRGFHHEAARVTIGERDAKYAVYSALLNGTEPETVANRAGIPLATRYLILSLHLEQPTDPEPAPPGRAAQLDQHRRSNTVNRVLDEFTTGDNLALIRDPGGTALVPLPVIAPSDEVESVRLLITELEGALAAPVYAACAIATCNDVPAAAVLTEEVLELVKSTGQAAGAWFLDDIPVLYQLTRPGPARDLLSRRLQPLDDHPDWERTLRTYVTTGFDRRGTARALHVHPNTVDYRLSRVAEECALDASDPSARPAAFAALAIRDVEANKAHPR